MELLIVIGVIAILVGIAYSVYGNIRWRTKLTWCMAHLHQCGIALRMYAQDWSGFVPPFTSLKIDRVPTMRNLSHFFFPHADDPYLFEVALLPYSKSKWIWLCPDERVTNSFDPYHFPPNHFTNYFIPPRYGTMAIPIDSPPEWVPYEIAALFDPPIIEKEKLQCVYCRWLKRVYFRWIYAKDFFHEYIPSSHPLMRFGTWAPPKFEIVLFLDGRVRTVDWWKISIAHRCPTDKLPSNLPDLGR